MASEQLSMTTPLVVIDEDYVPSSRERESVADQSQGEQGLSAGNADIKHKGAPESLPSTVKVQEERSRESGEVGEERGREEHMIGQDGPSIKEQRIGDEGSSTTNQTKEQHDGGNEYEETGKGKETGQEEASIKELDAVLLEASSKYQEGASVNDQTGVKDKDGTSEKKERLEQEGAHIPEHEGVKEHGRENEIASENKSDSEQERTNGDEQERGGDGKSSAGQEEGSEETKQPGVTGLEETTSGEELRNGGLLGGLEGVVRGDTGEHMEENRSDAAVEDQVIGDQSGKVQLGAPQEDTGEQITGQETILSTQDKGDGEAQGTGAAEHVTCVEGTGTHVEKDVGITEVEEGGSAGDQEQEVKVTGEATVSGVQGTVEEKTTKVLADGLSESEEVENQGTGQVSRDAETSTAIAGGETDTQKHLGEQDTDVQVTGTELQTAGGEAGVGDKEEFLLTSSVKEFTGAQETQEGKDAGGDRAGELTTSGQVSSSGEKEEREVTPDPTSDPSREGTVDPDRPAACWEREGQLLMCTGREVKADTAWQAETQVTGQELDHQTPAMKNRDFVEDGEISSPETPIEKEIRLSMEREQMLRQERGINLPVGQQELVEVRMKAVAGEQGPPADKERQLAGAQMQRDILLESRRELDLVQLGKVKGNYDRGPQQELQEMKMIFESLGSVSSEPVSKKWQSGPPQPVAVEAPILVASAASNHVTPSAPGIEVKKGPSYAEANGSNVILIEHGALLRRSVSANSSAPTTANLSRSTQVDSPQTVPGSPFQLLRSPSPRSILEREIEEVQERERELQRQRSSVYGRDESSVDATKKEPESRVDVQSGTYQPERPNWRKLEVNWPPSPGVTVNGQQSEQTVESPRTRRQRSALIQSWESGTPNPLDNE